MSILAEKIREGDLCVLRDRVTRENIGAPQRPKCMEVGEVL